MEFFDAADDDAEGVALENAEGDPEEGNPREADPDGVDRCGSRSKLLKFEGLASGRNPKLSKSGTFC